MIVDGDGRVLLVRKRGTTAFMQPGGKVAAGETAAVALCRELAEELEVTVADSAVRPLGRHVAEAANEPDHLVDAELFFVTLDAEPRAAAEIAELKWVDPASPGAIDIAPLTREIVFSLLLP